MKKILILMLMCFVALISVVSAIPGEIIIDPVSPTTNDAITAEIDGFPTTNYDWEWYLHPDLVNPEMTTNSQPDSTLGSVRTTDGETWTVEAYENTIAGRFLVDTHQFTIQPPPVIVGQSPPIVSNVFITVTEGDTVDVDHVFTDDGGTWFWLVLLGSKEQTYILDEDTPEADLDIDYTNPTSELNSNGVWVTQVGDAGDYEFEFTVTDLDGNSDTGIIYITVEPQAVVQQNNFCPTITANDIVVTEGNLALADVTTFDLDGNPVTVTYDTLFDANGEWQTGPGDDVGSPYTVVATATDGQCQTQDTFEVTVFAATNFCPTITASDLNITEGDLALANVTTFDLDGDTVNVTYDQLFNTSGEWQSNIGDATGSPYTVVATATDGQCQTQDTFDVTVNTFAGGNLCPTVVANNINVTEGDLAIADVTVTDPEGDPVTLAYDQFFDANGEWQTQAGDAGVYVITVTADDATCGATVQDTFTITVLNQPGLPNFCPNITANDIIVTEGNLATTSFTTFDLDGDPVAVTYDVLFDTNHEWQTVVGDSTGSPYTVIATVDDGQCQVQDTFDVTVLPFGANQCPTVTANDVFGTEEDLVLSDVVVTDPEGDPVTLTYDILFDVNGEWQTQVGDAGNYVVTVTADDGLCGATVQDTFTVFLSCLDSNNDGVCDSLQGAGDDGGSNFEGGKLDVNMVTILNANNLYSGYDVSGLDLTTSGGLYVDDNTLQSTAMDNDIVVLIEASNKNSFDAEELDVTFIINDERYFADFPDIDRGNKEQSVFTVPIEDNLESGKYALLVTIENDDIYTTVPLNIEITSLGDYVVSEDVEEKNTVITIGGETTVKVQQPTSLWDQIVDFFNSLF